jgi:hypothetical protein
MSLVFNGTPNVMNVHKSSLLKPVLIQFERSEERDIEFEEGR